MSHHMVDQAPRHDMRPDSNQAKRLRAREYLNTRGINLQLHGPFRYLSSIKGSSVLRHLRKVAR